MEKVKKSVKELELNKVVEVKVPTVAELLISEIEFLKEKLSHKGHYSATQKIVMVHELHQIVRIVEIILMMDKSDLVTRNNLK